MIRRTLNLTIALALLAGLVPAGLVSKTHAVTGSEWKAGRIIDDAIFANKNGMSPEQIQNFLNAKVPNCDTQGTQNTTRWNSAAGRYYTRAEWGALNNNPAPFTCLRDFYEVPKNEPGPGVPANNYGGKPVPAGAKSAAQIIWEAGQAYSINPKVLLTTIQKESIGPLTVDTWPFLNQYTYAMGARCPDTAPCDSNYAGFSIQIRESARLFRSYIDGMQQSWWPYKKLGNNYVLWNVQSTNCGGANIYIHTMATAALYTYTPYQPNAAALNNLYGTGDRCSAYGNRNFWRIFNDWFGPTVGPLVRTVDNPQLYYSDGTSKYIVPSMELAQEFGLGVNDVRFVEQIEIDGLTSPAPPNSKTLVQVVKSSSDSDEDGGAIYLITSGVKHQIGSMSQFSDFGFSTDRLGYLPLSHLQRLPTGGAPLSNFLQAPSLVAYKVESGKRRIIFDPRTLAEANPGGSVTPVSEHTLLTIPTSNPYVVGDAVLIGPDAQAWLYQDDSWFSIDSMNVYNCWNFKNLPNFKFGSYNQLSINTPVPIDCVAKKTDGSQYLLNSTNKLPVQASWGFTSFSQPLDRTIDALPNSAVIPERAVFQSPSSPTLYAIEGGKRRAIPSMQIFAELGKTSNDIVTVSPDLLNTIPIGTAKLSTGTLLLRSSGEVLIVKGQKSLAIPSTQLFQSYGFSASNAFWRTETDIAAYPPTGALPSYAISRGEAVLIDSQKRWVIPVALDSAFGITRANLPELEEAFLKHITVSQEATRFAKSPSSPTVYYLDNGQKRPVSSWQQLVNLGGQNQIVSISDWRISQFATGPAI